MNLSTDAWIPIVWTEGKPGIVSLCEAFEQSHEIQDLAIRPHERIALMRLLICIAQAALDGPADYDDWKGCRSRIVSSAVDYLQRWQQVFDLLGTGQRFLQLPNLNKAPTKSTGGDDDEGNSTSKLDLALATGNNTTLFDNAGGSERPFTPGKLALMLTTFQCVPTASSCRMILTTQGSMQRFTTTPSRGRICVPLTSVTRRARQS